MRELLSGKMFREISDGLIACINLSIIKGTYSVIKNIEGQIFFPELNIVTNTLVLIG